jgi:transcription elongation factor Elf1
VHCKKNPELLAKTLKCTVCGERRIVQLKAAKNRSTGHIKHMFCNGCKEETAHTELLIERTMAEAESKDA